MTGKKQIKTGRTEMSLADRGYQSSGRVASADIAGLTLKRLANNVVVAR